MLRTVRAAQHRLSVMLAADAITVAQLDVNGKSNEITAFIPLLEQVPCLRNVVISADMMHTQRKHARCLHRRGAYFVLPVGGNQPGLFDQLDALDSKAVPIGWMTYDRGHRRQEIRTIQVRPAPKGVKFQPSSVPGVTSIPMRRAFGRPPAKAATIARSAHDQRGRATCGRNTVS